MLSQIEIEFHRLLLRNHTGTHHLSGDILKKWKSTLIEKIPYTFMFQPNIFGSFSKRKTKKIPSVQKYNCKVRDDQSSSNSITDKSEKW